MYSLLFIAALAVQTDRPPWEPGEMVGAPAAASNTIFWERPIEVCGHVTFTDAKKGEAALYGTGQWLVIEMTADEELRVGSSTCVAGVVRRRDGLTLAQAGTRGLAFGAGLHSPSPHIILRRCSDRLSCEKLVPEDADPEAFRWACKAADRR
jgi:hypothetical protein